MYTRDAAYSSFREHELGTITKGKLADLVVLPQNILTCSPQSLLHMPVLHTIINGKFAYSK
ncbi:MAG: amidohydrolase family protein, partial [Chlamydiales bacterium]|nr:amidohydrolase family protein [Chlamydiales bacterium]